MAKVRPRLTIDEYDIIKEVRVKHQALEKECLEKGIPVESVSSYWHKSENFSIKVNNPSVSYFDVRDIIINDMISHSPIYTKIDRKKHNSPHLLVIDPADIHIGKLAVASETGETYNSNIAVSRVIDGVQGLLEKCNGFHVDQIMYIIGNDVLHTDTMKRTTTSGTPQDTDGMWHENFLMAKYMHICVIEMLRSIADVYVQYDPSNHDRMSGFFLADTLSSWFSKDKHIQFNCNPSSRKYFRYHNNLIGTTHGDTAKESDLPLLMAHETGKDWGECKHKYFYTHHIHHKRSKDYMGVTIESMRSPSGADGWHSSSGYQHAPKGIDAFIHHPEQGQIARLTQVVA